MNNSAIIHYHLLQNCCTEIEFKRSDVKFNEKAGPLVVVTKNSTVDERSSSSRTKKIIEATHNATCELKWKGYDATLVAVTGTVLVALMFLSSAKTVQRSIRFWMMHFRHINFVCVLHRPFGAWPLSTCLSLVPVGLPHQSLFTRRAHRTLLL